MPLHDAMFCEPSPGAGEIWRLACWAIAAPEVRLPLVEATDAARAQVKDAMQRAGLQGLMAKKKDDGTKIIADNRKARFAYAIERYSGSGHRADGLGSEIAALGKSTIARKLCPGQGRRDFPGQRLYPRIHASQPFQS